MYCVGGEIYKLETTIQRQDIPSFINFFE